jgi:iron complex outermembrane recepter protein
VDAGVEPLQPQLANPSFFQPLAGIGNTGCAPPAQLCAAPFNPSKAASSENTEINYNSYAIYGQVSYKFNDNWKVSGAIRYTEDQKKGWQEWRLVVFDGGVLGPGVGSGLFGSLTPGIDITRLATLASLGTAFPGAGPAFINAQTGAAQRTLSLNNGAVTGEADVDWTPDPSLLVYGKYSRGYKSGGWSTYTLGANPETQPEFVDAFEAGVKKSTGVFTLNGTVFYYNYYNEQTPLTIQDPKTLQLIPELFNIPLVHDYGIEISGNWRATDDLLFNLTYSYLSATVAQSPCVEDTVDPQALAPGANTVGCVNPARPGTQAQNIQGQTVPSATPNKVSLNGLYTFHFDPGNLVLSGTLVWKDGTYYDVFNRPYNFAPQYTEVNLRAIWSDAKDRYNVILFVNNVFNTIGYDGAAGTLLGASPINGSPDILHTPALTAPREYGIQFQYRFK